MTSVTQAIKHEEFIANVGRRYIDNWNEILTEEIIENARNRANNLREQWTVLRTKYNELDSVISEFRCSFLFAFVCVYFDFFPPIFITFPMDCTF